MAPAPASFARPAALQEPSLPPRQPIRASWLQQVSAGVGSGLLDAELCRWNGVLGRCHAEQWVTAASLHLLWEALGKPFQYTL